MVNLRSSGKDELERGSCSVFKISIEKEYFNMIKPEDKLHKQMQEYAETPAYFVCFSEEYALLGVSKASISYRYSFGFSPMNLLFLTDKPLVSR